MSRLLFIRLAVFFCATFYLTTVYGMRNCELLHNGIKLSSSVYVREDTTKHRRNPLVDFATILNSSIPDYKKNFKKDFYINRKGRTVGFFVFDLTDTLNAVRSLSDSINFMDNHIYHFAPIDFPWSFSHIGVLRDGKFTFFKSINCKKSKDKLADVILFIKRVLPNEYCNDAIIQRIRNYRHYGIYNKIDVHSVIKCECEPCI